MNRRQWTRIAGGVTIAVLGGRRAGVVAGGSAVELPALREGQVARGRQRVHAAAVHAVLQRDHAGERGQMGQRRGHDAHRADALDGARPGVHPRADQRLASSTSTCWSGATSSRRGWRRCPPKSSSIEIKKWFAAVAERYPNIDYLQVVNEPLHDPPDCTHSANQGGNCNASGNYARALGGANGTDGTGWDWILNAFRLAKQYFPNTKLMLNDYSITNSDSATDPVPADHQHPQAREPDRRHRRPGPRVLDHRQHGGAQGQPRSARRHRPPDPDHRARHRRRRGRRRARRRGAAAQLPPDRPGLLGAPRGRGHHGLGLAPAEPLAQRPERADRAVQRHAKPAGAWLYNYVRGIAPVDPGRRRASRSATSTPQRRHGRRPTTGPRQMGRPELRTFTLADQRRRTAPSRSRPGPANCGSPTSGCSTRTRPTHSRSASATASTRAPRRDVTVVTGDLANVADGTRAPPCRRRSSLTLGARAGFGAFTPASARTTRQRRPPPSSARRATPR